MRTLQNKEVLTTGEVAQLCHVAPRTVSKWFDSGQLRGYRIPGSRDRRIPVEHLLAFMRVHGIPLDGLDGGLCRVLIVGQPPAGLVEALSATNRYELRTAENGFTAGLAAQKQRPHAIVLETGPDAAACVQFCHNIKTVSELGGVKVIAVVEDAAQAKALTDAGLDGCLTKPYTPAQFARAIEEITNLIG